MKSVIIVSRNCESDIRKMAVSTRIIIGKASKIYPQTMYSTVLLKDNSVNLPNLGEAAPLRNDFL